MCHTFKVDIMFATSAEHPPGARSLVRTTEPPRYCLAPNGGAMTLQPHPARGAIASPPRRVIIDSATLREASANAFVVMMAETMQSVRAVRVVDARVLAPPVEGSITIAFQPGSTAATTIDVESARYASFEIFINAVRKQMAFKLRSVVSAVSYDANEEQFVLSVGSGVTGITITASDLNLLDLLGWTRAFTAGDGTISLIAGFATVGGSISLPPFQSIYAWPRSYEPAYVHVEQLRSTQQGAAGTVMQATSRPGQIVSAVQTLGGLNASLAYAFPQDLLFATVDPIAHHQTVEFSTPLARLSRLDIALRTADGRPYIAARLFLVLDVFCDHM